VGNVMRSNELSDMSSVEFSKLLVEEHLKIARINECEGLSCEEGELRKRYLETAEFHRSRAHHFEILIKG
jgi:hypothetical protein